MAARGTGAGTPALAEGRLDVLGHERREDEEPHIPKMMLGTAASSSMAVPAMRRSVGGASSTRNRAITRLSGTAIAIAIAVETSVP